MMIVATKLDESATTVRYSFGPERRHDRVLTLDKLTWQARTEDGNFDSAAASIAAKIKRGVGPVRRAPTPGAIFAS